MFSLRKDSNDIQAEFQSSKVPELLLRCTTDSFIHSLQIQQYAASKQLPSEKRIDPDIWYSTHEIRSMDTSFLGKGGWWKRAMRSRCEGSL
jgi:hypothetical protein